MNTKIISQIIFILATLALVWGVFQNNTGYSSMGATGFTIASTGTMAMNGWYLLSGVLYAAAIAVRSVFE